MAKKRTLLDPQNAITGIKALVANIVTMLIISVPLAIAFWVINQHDLMALGRLIQVLSFIGSIWIFGYIVYKWYSWK